MTVAASEAVVPTPTVARPAIRRRAWTLAAVCVLAALLYGWRIGGGQLGNSYYSAAVKSMTDGFTNFLFGSFDPYGVFTVDKPPMAFWPQAVSVLIFGYHGWALLLPQVIEGVGAVFLLHRTVRRWAGENAALLAALILALTPITVAINRDNNPDTLLVLFLVAAAYAFTRSVQAASAGNRTRWLLWAAFFVGCGFLTKMLQAWIVVPGIAVAYVAGTSGRLPRRLLDVLGAGGVLVVSSFWWVALHDLWPGDRPYMGGSTNGTAWDLIFGYNGFGRVFGGEGNRTGGARLPTGGFGGFGQQSGVTRMFNSSVGGQISWLLPLALLVLVAVGVAGVVRMAKRLARRPAERAGWYLWGSWLLVTMLVFSFAQGIWHPYYTTMLAPPIAAISAAGLVRFWHAYRDSRGARWLSLPLAIAVTAAWAFVLAGRDTAWYGWTRWAVLAVAAIAVVGLVVGRLSPSWRRGAGRVSLLVGLVAMLRVPAVWSAGTAASAQSGGSMPAAGPSGGFGGFRVAGRPGADSPGRAMSRLRPSGGGLAAAFSQSGQLTDEQQRILNYAQQHEDGAAITLALDSPANAATSYIIGSDATVIAMGGFMGSDDSPSVDQLENWTKAGELKFVLGSAGGSRGFGGFGGAGGFGGRAGASGAGQRRQQWIDQHCTPVDPAAYGGTASSASAGQGAFARAGGQTLYQCHA